MIDPSRKSLKSLPLTSMAFLSEPHLEAGLYFMPLPLKKRMDILRFWTSVSFPLSLNWISSLSVTWSTILARSPVGGLCPQSLTSTMDENKSTKTWSAWGREVSNLSKEKGQEPFPPWSFIRFILHKNTGKAHCQPVRVKQYIISRELWGLILSYGQLVKGL